MIYFDAAATSFLKPDTVPLAMKEALETMSSVGRGAYPPALAAARTVLHCREQIANLFRVSDPTRVCFTHNATEALNTAIFGLLDPEDHIITTALEHNSVLRPLYYLEEMGAQLTILPTDAQGRICLRDFETALRPNTKAVVCTHASNVTGNVLDLEQIGAFCRGHGLLLVVDAAQSAGTLEIDMAWQGISVLCFSGHKGLFGPQGTGGLCVAPEVFVRPLKVGGSGIDSFGRYQPFEYPEALEAGTLNVHGIAGLSAGLEFIHRVGLHEIHKREDMLAQRFYTGISGLSGVTIYGDWDAALRTAIVAMNIDGEDAGVVSDMLAEKYGICTRAGAHCAPLMHDALGTDSLVRFSFSYFNTEEEVDTAIRAVRELVMSC